MIRALAVFSMLFCGVSIGIFAQTPDTATVRGQIEDANHVPMADVTVTLTNKLSGLHRTVYATFFKINAGGVMTLASGLSYNYVTGSTNSGDLGATTDRPVIDSAVVGRNTGRGGAIYEVDPFLERVFGMGDNRFQTKLRVEAFNVLNHANFVGYSGTYGNGATAGAGFGQPLTGITNQLTARSLQFSAEFMF